MSLDYTHAVEVELNDGTLVRIGPDEYDAHDNLLAVDFDTERPGGFGPATVKVPRESVTNLKNVGHEAGRLFASVRIYWAETGDLFYRGRVNSVDVSEEEVSFSCEGWSKHGEDDETASVIFYDRDLSQWEGVPIERQEDFLSSGWGIEDGRVDDASGDPAVKTGIQGEWDQQMTAESWFDLGSGNEASFIDFTWQKSSTINDSDSDWRWDIGSYPEDPGDTNFDGSGNLRATGPGSGTMSINSNARWVRVALKYTTGPAGDEGLNYNIWWPLLGIVGNHGLPLQGSVSTPAEGRGLLVSDMVKYVVDRWCPKWEYISGPEGTIEETSFVVPHASFREKTTPTEIIDSLIVFGGSLALPLDWGVYEYFFLKSPGNYGTTWRVREDQTATSDRDGPDSSEIINGVVVTYDDGTGKKLSVGPPDSGADFETSDLEDTDPLNPANEDGVRHWKSYEAEVTFQDGAVLIGGLILSRSFDFRWRGSVDIQDVAVDQNGIEYPVAKIRAGDKLIVEDSEDTDERLINNTSYDSEERVCSASVGADPDRLDVLLARLGVVLEGRL